MAKYRKRSRLHAKRSDDPGHEKANNSAARSAWTAGQGKTDEFHTNTESLATNSNSYIYDSYLDHLDHPDQARSCKGLERSGLNSEPCPPCPNENIGYLGGKPWSYWVQRDNAVRDRIKAFREWQGPIIGRIS